MGELDRLRERVDSARRGYAALPREGWGEAGPLDESTGERWDRGHVLGHVAEMLPYWTAQARAVLAGADAMGRDEVGAAQRRMGIDAGREAGEQGLLDRIDAGIVDVDRLLAEMTEADLDRPVRFRAAGADREATLGQEVEQVLVDHLEEHLRQAGG